MARYECTKCGAIGENTTCLLCGSTEMRKLDSEPLSDPVKESIEQQSSALAEAQGTTRNAIPPRTEAKSRPPASMLRMPSRADPAATAIAESRQEKKIVDLDQFEALMKRGVKAVVICGGGNAGKSEIAHGFTRARKMLRGRTTTMTLGMNAGVRYDVALAGTAPGSVWYQLIDRRHAFLDPSGEFFNKFSGTYRKSQNLGDLDESYFDFVRGAVRKLAGIILVFDLTNVEDPTAENPWHEQEAVLSFTLDVLRWLRYDKGASYQELELITRMSFFLEKKKKKLDVPVLVLFSKADRLAEYDYTNEHPLSFARNNLPTLHASLLTNARKFRFDYAHTMVQREDGKDYPAKYPCGVLLSIEWLLGDAFRPLPPLSTSWLGGGK